MLKSFHHLAGCALVLASIAGCGNSGAPATQIAAQVNADEITVHQINYVLERSPGLTPANVLQAKRQVLERLVDQQLARQQAIERKLDRTPAVMQSLEAARTEILARAYFEQIAAAQPKATRDEARRYYTEHPELFAERRVFMLEEITLASGQEITAGLREKVGKSRSMQEVAAWLRAKDVKFTERRGVRSAEQIPLQALPALLAMKEGEIREIGGVGTAYIVQILATRRAPVDEASALPRIEQFLFNLRSSEAIATQMKQIRAGANIKYTGEFAAAAAGSESAANGATLEPAPMDKSGLEKGIRGLR